MSDDVVLYGLANCDTCRKARHWLDRRGVAHRFVDYRDERQSPATLKRWADAVGGWPALINRTGPTWRNLPAARKDPITDPEWTLLLREHPALVRRPVLDRGGAISTGFSDKLYARFFA